VRLCAVITEEKTALARDALRRAARVADLAEIRLDYLRDFDFGSLEALRLLLAGKRLPVILTCRAVEEGGVQRIDDSTRLKLVVEGSRRLGEYCDIEAAHYQQAARLNPDLSRLILSYHNLTETPANLRSIYRRLTARPAAIHKIVTYANDVTDCLATFRVLEQARQERRKLIALAMGPRGLITRVLAPSRGGFLTYASLGKGRESAAGQPTCEELADLYRIRQLTRRTRIAGIVGNPVGHSVSPQMHNRAFAAAGLDWVYLPFESSHLAAFVKGFLRAKDRNAGPRLSGLSVTIPYKTSIIGMLDKISPTAKAAGAVNTVLLKGNRLIGENTDVDGAMAPLDEACDLRRATALVVGAGGAARAVIHGLLVHGAAVEVFARNKDKAREFVRSYDSGVSWIERVGRTAADVVINATPVGMRGHSDGKSPIRREVLRGRRIAYDLVYNPIETRFLKDAREAGCKTIGGLEMLVAQAAGQFELWTGREAPVELMREAALSKLRET
jgi:3-dehydroquinate dehydratase/shikimate dehydrogenase